MDNVKLQRKICISLTVLIIAIRSIYCYEFLYVPMDPHIHCPENEMYRGCISACNNCEYRGTCRMEPPCTGGCDCRPNFVRLEPGGKCQHVSKCPKPECSENEVYRDCGPVCEKCETQPCHIFNCHYKCYCKEGYLRLPNNTCILEDECLERVHCSFNEEWRERGPMDEFCYLDNSKDRPNKTREKEGCYCQTGYKRSSFGRCMDEEICEIMVCPRSKEFTKCPSSCNNTCHNYDDETCKEDGNCYPGCICHEGYVFNDFGLCVLPETCPPGSNPVAPTVLPTTAEPITESSINGNASDVSVNSDKEEDTPNQDETYASPSNASETISEEESSAVASADTDDKEESSKASKEDAENEEESSDADMNGEEESFEVPPTGNDDEEESFEALTTDNDDEEESSEDESSPDAKGNEEPSEAESSAEAKDNEESEAKSSADAKGNEESFEAESSADAKGNEESSEAESSADANGNEESSKAESSADANGNNKSFKTQSETELEKPPFAASQEENDENEPYEAQNNEKASAFAEEMSKARPEEIDEETEMIPEETSEVSTTIPKLKTAKSSGISVQNAEENEYP